MLSYENSNEVSSFLNNLYTHNIYPLTNKPTRITKESATLIDNILTSEITSTIKSGILLSDVTDHFPIFCFVDYNLIKNKGKTENRYCYRRKIDGHSVENFKTELTHICWNDVISCNNVTDAYDLFLNKFSELFNNHCPL